MSGVCTECGEMMLNVMKFGGKTIAQTEKYTGDFLIVVGLNFKGFFYIGILYGWISGIRRQRMQERCRQNNLCQSLKHCRQVSKTLKF